VFPRSRQEISLACELLTVFDFAIDDHKETIGGRVYDCDIIIRRHGVIVEFDGSYWHEGHDREDLEKTTSIQEAGWRVIRVREQPLDIISPLDVSVPLNLNMKPAADAVLMKIRDELDVRSESIDHYLAASDLQNSDAAEAYFRDLVHASQKKPPTSP
jgi:hypothetical protein